jgi:hypothetical protein
LHWNKKALSVIGIAPLALSFFLAGTARSAEISITNELTKSHMEAPGTAAYFVPADGMSPSGRFTGFVSETRGIEFIVANLKSPYKEISEAFTESTLKTRGLELGSRAELTINGLDATLLKALHVDGDKKWGKWILLLDSGGSTIVANGMFTSGDGDAARDIEAMIKSVVLKNGAPAVNAEAPATSPSDADKGLDLALSSGSVVYTDEKMVNDDDDKDD